MTGKVLKPKEWLRRKLLKYPELSNDVNLPVLNEFIDFLDANNLYMSVLEEGRTTKNSSIYVMNSTDRNYWLCDVKFFEKGSAKISSTTDIIIKEKMNNPGIIYDNQSFAKVLEVITNLKRKKSKYAKYKTKVSIPGFKEAISTLKKAISIHLVYQNE